MFIQTLRRCVLHILILATTAVLAGCAGTPFVDSYRPGATEVVLWGPESIPMEPGWRFVGDEQVMVRGKLRDTYLTPVDLVQTLVFVREGEEPARILLFSRVIKTTDREVFVFLGGSKTQLGGREYRDSLFFLSAATTDPEYERYFAKVAGTGAALAPSYRVRVLDRLPVDTVLVRIMGLTPGEGASQLPPYGKLYPQDLDEPVIRTFR
jgi:hypothetical protein